jgi:hypothetical protein
MRVGERDEQSCIKRERERETEVEPHRMVDTV